MIPAVFKDVADSIPQGSVLLWRPTSQLGRIIAKLDRTLYSHVGTFYRARGVAYSLEFLQWQGGVQKPLAEYVARYPGKIDVYVLPVDQDIVAGEVICNEMRRLIRAYPKYGWWNLLRVSRWHLPGVRLFGSPDTRDDRINGGAPHCSMARAKSDWAAGHDFVHNTPPHNTTPGDYARCSELYGRYTLFETREQIQALEEKRCKSDKRPITDSGSWQHCFC